VVIGILLVYIHRSSVESSHRQVLEDVNTRAEYVVLQGNDYFKGSASSSIVVIEYFDLECPGCKLAHTQLRPIQSKMIDKGVTFVYRSFPLVYLHKQAQTEALAHECAGLLGGQSAYFSFMEKVYYNTKSNDTLDLSLLPLFAKELSLNVEDFNFCRAASSTRDLLNSRISRGLSQGIYSTPSYVILNKGVPVIILRGRPAALNDVLDSLITKDK
jgi:protein-disulfide isomerase